MTMTRAPAPFNLAWFALFLFALSFGTALHGAQPSALAGPRETLSLDGPWQIVFDKSNRGRAEGWQNRSVFDKLPSIQTINVPSAWETICQDYEGVAWYRRRVRTPAAWKDRFVRLRFGAVNYRAEVWVNEHPAGYHEGGYTPFELRVGDLLKHGEENEIVVRVIGPVVTKDLYVDGYGRNDTPHWRGAIAGGIWQPVTLTASAPVFIQDVFVEPEIQRSRALVNLTLMNTTRQQVDGKAVLALDQEPDTAAQAISLRPGRSQVRIELRVSRLRLWSPETPHLYTVITTIEAGASRDQLRTRFGMREFTICGNRFCLNGKPIHFRAGFWEGFYPGTLVFPPNAEIVRKEILLAKEAGFNVLRPWRKPPPPPILEIADELGMMVIGAPPIECMGHWPRITPETEERLKIEVREMVLRDRNHASLIYWEIFNEIIRFGLKRLKHEVSLVARQWDPTRIVVDESGGWADGAAAYPPRSFEPEPFNELHVYRRAPVDDRIYNLFKRVGGPGFDPTTLGARGGVPLPGKLMIISEIGYGGWPDFVSNVEQYKREGNPLTPDYRNHEFMLRAITKAYEELNWREVFPDLRSLLLSSQKIQAVGNKLQLEAVRLNPHAGGYCLHAYTDGDWVLGAGVLDVFRNKKLVFDELKLVQQPLYLAVRVSPANVYAERGAELQVEAANDLDTARGRLRVEVKAPNGETVYAREQAVEVRSGVQEILRAPLRRFPVSGKHVARLSFSGSKPFQNEFEFFVLGKSELTPPKAQVAVLDPEGKLMKFLAAAGVPAVRFSENLAQRMPVLVSAEAAADEQTFRLWAGLIDYVERGGEAVLLRPPLERADSNNSLLRTGLFPHKLASRRAVGNWVPANHAARPHPIFEGLPLDGFLGQTYQNILPVQAITGLGQAPIVGVLSADFNAGNIDRDYRGLAGAWWGSDVTLLPHGKGHFLLSTMLLLEHLGQDPVADKLLLNMIRWMSSRPGSLGSSSATLDTRFQKQFQSFRKMTK
jgi:hypothetical protein